jgi:hypothetical protein
MNIHESGNEYSGKFSWIFTQKYHNSNEYEFWFLQFELNWIFEKSQKTQFKLNRFESIRIKCNSGGIWKSSLSGEVNLVNRRIYGGWQSLGWTDSVMSQRLLTKVLFRHFSTCHCSKFEFITLG